MNMGNNHFVIFLEMLTLYVRWRRKIWRQRASKVKIALLLLSMSSSSFISQEGTTASQVDVQNVVNVLSVQIVSAVTDVVPVATGSGWLRYFWYVKQVEWHFMHLDI